MSSPAASPTGAGETPQPAPDTDRSASTVTDDRTAPPASAETAAPTRRPAALDVGNLIRRPPPRPAASTVVSLVPPTAAPVTPASTPVPPAAPDAAPAGDAPDVSAAGPASTRPRPAPNRRSASGKGRRTPTTPATTPPRRATSAAGSSRTRAALETLFDELGLDVTVTEVGSSDSGPTALLALGPDLFAADLEPYAADLAATLRAKSVWFVAPDEETVRVESLRRPERPAGASRRQCTVLIPAVVKEALKAAAEPTGKTENSFVLDAFDRQFDRLDTFFPHREAGSGPMQAPHRTVRRGLKQERMTLHLTPPQEAALDAAQRSSGAGSRSELISRILEEDLGVDGTPPAAG